MVRIGCHRRSPLARLAGVCVATCVTALAFPPAWARADEPASDSLPEATPALDDATTERLVRNLQTNVDASAADRFREEQSQRRSVDRELRALRHRHFSTKHAPTRQAGLDALRSTYDRPALYPLLIDVFAKEDRDVQSVLLEMFAGSASDAGDGALAWSALFGRARTTRDQAMLLVQDRVRSSGEVPLAIRLTLRQGITSHDPAIQARTANLIDKLDLGDLVQWLIAAQATAARPGQQMGEAPSGRGGLAFIAIGQQTAYVSDLQPIVAEGAVAFDPQLSIVTTGVVVRIDDAYAYSYNMDVHHALVRLTSRLTDQDTAPMGFDYTRWMRWYATVFEPVWKERQAKLRAPAPGAEAAPGGG